MVNHSNKTVRVSPAPGEEKPSWGGYIPQQHSFVAALALALDDGRAEHGESLRHSPLAVVFDDGQAHVWTFAGGRINRTLRYVFELVGGFMVASDNFQIKMKATR